MVEPQQTKKFVETFWEDNILPTIKEYIRIPNVSSMFDKNWKKNGYVDQALDLTKNWIEEHKPDDANLHVGYLEGRTPLILLEIPGKSDETVLMYGHLDKQPGMSGWRNGLDPWNPVREGDLLYGRGGADDGYALFASICALRALREQGVSHARIVMLIEFSEESGSPDLPAYVDHFSKLIQTPSLIICLDSGAGNYDQLWSTTSLRGLVGATLRVDVLEEGVHSGDASGIVPSSFRIARQLIERIEDQLTGLIRPELLNVTIPEERIQQATAVAKVLGDSVSLKFPWAGKTHSVNSNVVELILNRTWRPALSITGQKGIPTLEDAGNVLRPSTTLNLSLRIPPTLDPNQAMNVLTETLTTKPPYEAKITLQFQTPAAGWNAPILSAWLAQSLDNASNNFYGKPALHMGEGGSIPFMSMLGKRFPNAQFIITGVLGPQSNAHGPNEFLHIDYAKKLTCCVTQLLHAHFERN